MKKMFSMVMVIMVVLMAITAVAETNDEFAPLVHLYDLEKVSFGDGCDLHMTMYIDIPDEGYVRVEAALNFTDNMYSNYNEGTLSMYDAETGELLDETYGSISDEVDCSSKNIEEIRKNMMEYVNHYDFEKDYVDNGVRYWSVWF